MWRIFQSSRRLEGNTRASARDRERHGHGAERGRLWPDDVPSTCVKRWERMAPFGAILVTVASFTFSSRAALRCLYPLRHRRRRRVAALAGAAAARDPDRCPMVVRLRGRDLSGEQRRALEILAGSPHGCTEATLRAHGFTVLARIVRAGRAVASGAASREAPGQAAYQHRLRTTFPDKSARCALLHECMPPGSLPRAAVSR